MLLGQRIELLMDKKGWNQKQLAEKININTSVLNRIIKGTRPVRDEELALLSTVFEVSTDYLLGNPIQAIGRVTRVKPENKDENFYFFDEEKVTPEELEELKKHLKYLRWQAQQENNK